MSDHQENPMTTPTTTQLIDIWMGGNSSGLLTAFQHVGLPEGPAKEVTATWHEAIRADPIALDLITTQINEILTATNPTPDGITLVVSLDRWATTTGGA